MILQKELDQAELLMLEQEKLGRKEFVDELINQSVKVVYHDPYNAFGDGDVRLISYFFEDGSTITTDGESFKELPSKQIMLQNMDIPTNTYLN